MTISKDQLRQRLYVAELKARAFDAMKPVYEELVKALNSAKLEIEYLHGKFQQTGTGNQTLAQVEQALSRVEQLEREMKA